MTQFHLSIFSGELAALSVFFLFSADVFWRLGEYFSVPTVCEFVTPSACVCRCFQESCCLAVFVQ